MNNCNRFRCIALDGSSFHWEQDLSQIFIYISLDFKIKSNDIKVNFNPNSLVVMVKNKDLLRGNLCKTVLVDDCCWTFSDNSLEIILTKSISHKTWEYLLDNCDKLNVNEIENQKGKILLERFQQDHPSFDFNQASIHGNVPDAYTFLR